ncbi:MAG: hypothetical protein EXS48_03460 [Candidatus Staskawiczbacteria bacterium]|nr:hypothetical protein [Candidatus Staskawiczbacteria bacterium]
MGEGKDRTYGDEEEVPLKEMSTDELKRAAQGMQFEINKATRAEDDAYDERGFLQEYLAEIKNRTGQNYDPQDDRLYSDEE